jgi:hypothetical protein
VQPPVVSWLTNREKKTEHVFVCANKAHTTP